MFQGLRTAIYHAGDLRKAKVNLLLTAARARPALARLSFCEL